MIPRQLTPNQLPFSVSKALFSDITYENSLS
jgi:hypothetical protein